MPKPPPVGDRTYDQTMQNEGPDWRLDYIVEGIKLEGAIVRYEPVGGDDPGWKLHIFEAKTPGTAMFTFPIREADVDHGERRASLRSKLDSQYRMCFMD